MVNEHLLSFINTHNPHEKISYFWLIRVTFALLQNFLELQIFFSAAPLLL